MKLTFSFSIDTIIALIALLLAIASAIYTWISNQYSITLIGLSKDISRGETKVQFTVVNTSPKPLVITNIELFFNKNKITDNNFDPIKYDKNINKIKAKEYEEQNKISLPFGGEISTGFNPYNLNLDTSAYSDTSNNFEDDVFLPASDKVTFSYFVDEIPNIIVVSTNHKINHFKKNKLFFVHFNED
ncbi:hypothetical protein ACWOF5_05020 [Carnobacterium divergens]